jgi:hypothetical protein
MEKSLNKIPDWCVNGSLCYLWRARWTEEHRHSQPHKEIAVSCLAMKSGYECTREKGHSGYHIACGITHNLKRWIKGGIIRK